MGKNKVSQKETIHSIMVILGEVQVECCPECGSQQWYKTATFSQSQRYFSDGYVEEGPLDYEWSSYNCNDCGHDHD